ncbi:hypothetical protein TKWG_15150 [Advenella kashmirensis WT001]|uniref:Uncharacterized protein n=1 Tax=Advenella kashmirensis (strain DSM 17095 / LMG 22695 / WT001) TaxID=1036672 RepID=I3UDG4_ADVKW|nr:hypothetical protein [Advenella kashmirensis]AFK63052.1 hypothetical protein TKWG_15150 [Advenella kashmirensis WT001]
MSISAPTSPSYSVSTASNAVKIIVDSNQASHIDSTGNCYVNPDDCAVQHSPGSTAYIFDIEFLQQLRRHLRKAGRFELEVAPLSHDLKNVAASLLTVLQKNVTPG